jgi:hypothetical protein
MLSLIRDLLWWFVARSWRVLRSMSGDDAYERHLALERTRPDADPLDRREVYERELDRKWARYSTCGRCFER